MENDYKSFYSSYLKDYHQVKTLYLKMQLENIDELNIKLNEKEFDRSLTDNTEIILKAEMRQNYFHAIESFFELFFALIPKEDKVPDNTQIIKKLVKSNWRKNYSMINDIANGNFKIKNLLKREISFNGHLIEVGHYLFYLGIFNKVKFKDAIEAIKKSYDGIAKGIVVLAKDFSDRDEYNAYKHALRIYPTMEKLILADQKTLTERLSFDLSNSVSYQIFDKKANKTTIKTKLLDSERDSEMTSFCSNLIHHMIYFRDLVYNADSQKISKEKQIKISIFDNDAIAKCSEHNVEIQNLEFSVEKRSHK
jgi:hypothetical protein